MDTAIQVIIGHTHINCMQQGKKEEANGANNLTQLVQGLHYQQWHSSPRA